MKRLAKKSLSVLLAVMLLLSVFTILAAAGQEPEIKNIIYLIGDGMGTNQLEAYKQKHPEDALVMESFPIIGKQNTRSYLGIKTDSAAGGTALACGLRTWINAVGVYPTDPFALFSYPKNIREVAAEQGMKTGVVVTKVSDDATPATFTAHTYSRSNKEEINAQQLTGGTDIIMGAETGYINAQNAAENGYTYVTNRKEMQAAAGADKLYGQFDGKSLKADFDYDGNTPFLWEMTEQAIAMLENDDGFFLMVEGSTIDSYCHSNEMDGMMLALDAFDKAVEVALDYAKENQDTLVVITADHETGGIIYKKGEYVFTTGNHSLQPVYYMVYAPEGMETAFTAGEDICNYEIPLKIAQTIGWDSEWFPARQYTKAGEVLELPLTLAEDAVAAALDVADYAIDTYVPDAAVCLSVAAWFALIDFVALFF